MNTRAAVPILMLATFLVSGCDEERRTVVKGRLRDAWSQVSDKDYVRTRGIGSAPATAQGQTHRRGLSRNAALVAARYEMLAVIKGIKVTGGLTVGNLMEKDSKIAEIANRIIHGAEEVLTEFTSDDGCVVTLELKRDRIEKLVEQDKPWEPPTEREVYQSRVREQDRLDLEPTRRMVYNTSYSDGKSPGAALALGLLFPGAGQLYADEEGSRRGWFFLAGVAGLASVGAYYYQPHEVGSTMSDGTKRKESAKDAGLVFFGLAGLLHVAGAVDGMNTVRKKSSTSLTFMPVENGRGARVAFSRRF